MIFTLTTDASGRRIWCADLMIYFPEREVVLTPTEDSMTAYCLSVSSVRLALRDLGLTGTLKEKSIAVRGKMLFGAHFKKCWSFSFKIGEALPYREDYICAGRSYDRLPDDQLKSGIYCARKLDQLKDQF